MNPDQQKSMATAGLRTACRPTLEMTGSVLVYLVVVILVFGVLGVTMVSLFTSATTSSATPNNSRQACALAEAATRYAYSELKANDFAESTIDDLNATTYNLADGGSFSMRVLGLWFGNDSGSGTTHNLFVPKGILPDGFKILDDEIEGTVWAFNLEYVGTAAHRAEITADERIDDKTLRIHANNFIVSTGERVSLAVQPSNSQTVSQNVDLYVEPIAKKFFPLVNGAIHIYKDAAVDISKSVFSYERLIDEDNRVKLTNVELRSDASEGTPSWSIELDPAQSDLIVLAPRNYLVIPSGLSDSVDPVACGNDFTESRMNIFNSSEINAPPDITADELTDNIREVESHPDLIQPNPDTDTLDVGSGYPPVSRAESGAAWYSGDQSIGGDSDVCNTGSCEFGSGIRVFFTLNYTGNGDGLTFTLMNADPHRGQ